MNLPPALDRVKLHPELYLAKVEFATAAALVKGYNMATDGGFLTGFREWLIPTLDYGNNLTWEGLVFLLVGSNSEPPGHQLNEEENQRDAVVVLFGLLEAFCELKETPNGLRQIYVRYQHWLQRQDWYGPSSPDYLTTPASE